MPFPFVRKIEFIIPAIGNTPSVQVIATEVDGNLVFELQVHAAEPDQETDLRGLFLNLNDREGTSGSDLAEGLKYVGKDITDFKTSNAINFKNGTNLKGKSKGYDVGINFGTPGVERDEIDSTSFTLIGLTLDDIANTQFGARINGNKLTVEAPAAPDAKDDIRNINEESAPDLDSPSTIPTGTVFHILDNDTDADADKLTITDIAAEAYGPQHGTVEIIDGDDDDDLIGDAVLYTPFEDFSGADSFYYLVDDGNGGNDFAKVDVNIEAVADIPNLSYEILAGTTVNEIIVRVTTSQTDADSSEFIDRIELTGIPEGVIVNTSLYNPIDEPDSITHDFILTLPRYQDANFSLGITSVSKEVSNDDEEIQSTTAAIIYDETLYDFDHTYEVEGHNMWSSGDALGFTDERFIGVESGVDSKKGSTFYADYDIDYKLGFQSTLNIDAGSVDASISYDVGMQTLYNETTDWLRFETDSTLLLDESMFSTQSPIVEYLLNLVVELESDTEIGVDIDIPGTPAVEVEGIEIFPAIPGFEYNNHTDIDFSFAKAPTLLEFDGDSLNLFGLEGDSAVSIDLTPNGDLYLEASIPHFTTDSEINEDHLISSGSDNFFSLNADIDQIVSTLAGFPVNPFGDSIEFGRVELSYDLMNYVISGAIGVGQDFTMSFGDLNASLLFEDGFSQDFVLGEDFNVVDASSHDANNDGDLDFDLVLTPDATFESNLLLTLQLLHEFELLKASVSVDVPVFDDPEYDLGPVFSYDDILAETSIDIIGLPSFSFDLGSSETSFIV